MARAMVGRDAELDELRRLAARARDGVGAVAVLSGEAGIGKSRLIAEFGLAERAVGTTVVVGHGVDLAGGHLPFAALSDSLRDLLRQLGADEMDRLAPDACRSLGSLVPELTATLGRSETDRPAAAPDRVEVLGAAIHLLEAVAASRPLCWVVEDVQWVDPQTLDLLRIVGPSVESRPMVLLTSFRTPVLETEAAAVLADLASRAHATSVRLVRLDEASARRQLRHVTGSGLDPVIEDRILGLAEGLPLFIEHLALEARVDPTVLPESLAAIVEGRLRRLGSTHTSLLEVVSVADGPVAVADLALVLPEHPDQLGPVVDDTVSAQVLEVTADGRLDFTHALVKEIVAARLPPTRRQRLERAWARVLEAKPADLVRVVVIAHHRLAAGDGEQALAAFAWAARLAARGADSRLETACLVRVHELWGSVRDPGSICGMGIDEVLFHLCVAGVASEQRDQVAPVVAAELRGGRPELDGITRLWLTLRLEQLGTGADSGSISTGPAQQTTRDRAAVLLAAPSGLAAMDALHLVGRAARRFDGTLAARLHRRALAMARLLGGARARLRSEVFVGFDHLARVRPLDEARRLMRLERDLGDLPLADWAIVAESVVLGLVDGGRYEEASSLAEAALQRLQDPALAPRRYAGLALVLASARVELGDWAAAERWLETVEACYGPAWAEVAGLRLRIASRRGSRRELAALLDGVAGALEPAVDLVRQSHELADLVAALYESGDVDGARRCLDVLRGGTRDWWFAAVWPAVNAAVRFEVEAQRRQPDAAGVLLLARLDELCDALELVAPSADAFRAEHRALIARSRGADTVDDWVAAAEAWSVLGRSWDEAVCRVRLAETAWCAGDLRRARDEVRRAQAIAGRLGAGPLDEEARSRGRDWGVSFPRAGRRHRESSLPSLTARERQVLELVAEGRTNGEVARLLVMSPKTVSVHVSHILAKLQAGNRTEAVSLARRSGLLG